ncbi:MULTISPECIES: RidA family protein [Methylobacterium]|jgi:enamine deaminase RidA (YjgF/YER057c/UK114 family)|uniref:RidA family protein n=1 Tax=Methylobacterium TaxID=407 RepID=UPI00089EE815|nr:MULTISPECIES: RidA family protein [unclassified Methylobacterium]SEG59190.1 Enamine deaminase RidA, house cleaning of reactive enamine intermediates, YjgF/YER057c/UK114 family [Methylobacterium sp. 190mf]SFF01494.1 Enamine deaminase RidA, house cleaning of reactive enamine intermediates, YjgF/YER057c/UK114 family [Methylobacterium sp. 13MFTsu3.1M2]
MSRRLITSGSPFERDYGYSRAVVDGDTVYLSGTTGYDYATMTMPDGAAAQAEACWRTIRSVLAEAGTGLAGVLRATYYVTDRDDAEAVLAVCGRVLADVRPAATIVVVAGLLRPEMRVEIEVTARIG